jgi:hypothetical protein
LVSYRFQAAEGVVFEIKNVARIPSTATIAAMMLAAARG